MAKEASLMEEAIGIGARRPGLRTMGLSWPLIVALLAVFGVLCLLPASRGLGDPDTYWHISAGNWILANGTVPSGDPFSHSLPNAAWTTQEWLSEVVLATVYDAGGWSAIVVLATMSYALTLALLTRFLLSRMEPVHALFFVGFAAGMMLTHLLVRPHVLAWPLMALWIGALVQASESRQHPPRWLLLVMLLWANLHGGFTLGLALSVGIALDAVVSSPAGARWRIARGWFAFIALATLVSTITPNGWLGLWYTIHVMLQHDAKALIDEWQSPNFHQPQPVEVWLIVMLLIALSGRMRLPVVRLAIVLGLLHLALTSVRSVSMLGLVSPFLLATPVARDWYQGKPLGGAGDAEQLDRWFRAFAAPARPATVAVSVVLAAFLLTGVVSARQPAPTDNITPRAALEAARAAGVRGEVLNAYNFGGYLIFEGVKVFVDGRSELYQDAFLTRAVEAFGLQNGQTLTDLLDEYRIGWTLLEPRTPAIVMLDQLPGWRRVYADDTAVVHMRTADVPAR
jgi:hypothetical protein